MARKSDPFERSADGVISPLPSPSNGSFEREPASSSDGKISPAVLMIIVILAVIFFVCGVLHMVVRFVMKRPSFYSFSRYRRNPDGFRSEALQRQLQELFRLHDSGLDQDIIDALPVFCYRDIVGSKEPFDCAVCLCEFSDQDQLRLLPDCSHAFHVNCIDTWLLSNSTCPLCRGTLLCAGYSFKDQLLGLDYFRELSNSARSTHLKPTIMEEPDAERRVYSVRLGKFRTVNTEGVGMEEPSRSNLDARRCYSLGSCQYVIDDSDLLVSLSDSSESETRGRIGSSLADADVEAMRISNSTKGESFSISKIWQWSKKGKFPTSSDANASNGCPSVV